MAQYWRANPAARSGLSYFGEVLYQVEESVRWQAHDLFLAMTANWRWQRTLGSRRFELRFEIIDEKRNVSAIIGVLWRESGPAFCRSVAPRDDFSVAREKVIYRFRQGYARDQHKCDIKRITFERLLLSHEADLNRRGTTPRIQGVRRRMQ